MFSIVITEKGGAQRRLEFDQAEITIGRIQGNDVILPKGNVSKKHSRIVLKDGRFVVLDLKSTNGTYVNGRRITQPLVVKPTDKIYIGDFILTVEGLDASAAPSGRPPAAAEPRLRPPAPPAPPSRPEPPSAPPTAAAPRLSPAPEPPEPPPPVVPYVPSPPPVPHIDYEPTHARASIDDVVTLDGGPSAPSERPQELVREAVRRAGASVPSASERMHFPGTSGPATSAFLAAPQFAWPTGFDVALGSIMTRLAERFDVRATDPQAELDGKRRAEARRAITAIIEELEGEALLDSRLARDELARAALREAVGLGALELLLEDATIRETLVEDASAIGVDRGAGFESTGLRFSSNEVLTTVIQRLLAQAGEPLEGPPLRQFVLPWGALARVALPPLAMRGPSLEIRRLLPAPTFGELVAQGVVDPDVRDYLERAIAAGHSILVAGPRGSGVTTIVGALASAVDPSERLVTLSDAPDLSLSRERTLALWTGGTRTGLKLGELIAHGIRMRADRLVIDGIEGEEALEALRAAAARGERCILGLRAAAGDPLGALRMLASLAAPTTEAAVERLLDRAAHLVVEVERTADGPRVTRVSQVISGPHGTALRVVLPLA